MSRALVLGGGGHLGSSLCRALVARGWDVVATTRTPGARANLQDLPVQHLHGDDAQPGRIAHWSEGAQLIVDAAAPYGLSLHEQGSSHRERITRAQTRMQQVLEAARGCGAGLIYIGSYLTTPDANRPILDRALAACHPYFRIKRTLEAQAMTAAQNGQPVVIANPTSFLGPGNLRTFRQCFVAAVLSGAVPASFPDQINVMDVRDTAEACLRCYKSGLFGVPVRLSGYNISVHDLTARISELGQGRLPPQWQGLGAAAAVLYWTENAAALLGRQAKHPALPVLLTLASRAVEIGPMQRGLGLQLRPLDDTLRDEITWYRQRGLIWETAPA